MIIKVRSILIIFFIGFNSNFLASQKMEILESIAKEYTVKSFPMLKELLSIPNDASNLDWIEKNIIWCEKQFTSRGFSSRRLQTKRAPLLLVEKNFVQNGETVLIYLQMDGQPVDSSRWDQEDPYKPELKKLNSDDNWEKIEWDKIYNYDVDWRVFARSASDAKGPVSMFLASLDAMEKYNYKSNFNIKVILDFEEELGSPNLPESVSKNIDFLDADMLIIFDGPLHRLNKPTLTFGARGISTVQLTTYGPIYPQHSGHYGNYVPNPALRLSKILSSMKDDNGVVTIPNFYDGINLTPEIKKILAATPHNESELQELLQIGDFDKVGDNYQESIQYPSLNIRGMQSGWINDEVRTIIPSWARAELDVRLVIESDPDKLLSLIKKYIKDQGYLVLDREPSKEERIENPKIVTFTSKVSYQSFRTNLDEEVSVWLQRAIERAFEIKPILIRMSGGSIPISPFVNELNIPAVTVPTVNRDNNQHSPNENIRLGNYKDGIKTILAVLTEKL